MQESDILYQSGPRWITLEKVGKRGNSYYIVWEDKATHAIKVATIGVNYPDSWARAVSVVADARS